MHHDENPPAEGDQRAARIPAGLMGLAAREGWSRLAEALGDWVPRQRWFQGKAKVVIGLRVVDTVVLDGEPNVLDVLVEVAYAGEEPERYQVPLVAAAEWSLGGVVASLEGVGLRDALADPDACRVLAASAMRTQAVSTIGGGTVQGRPVGNTTASDPGGGVRPMGVEQSNTSAVIGDAVLKVFRRLESGPNPDVEITRALTTAGFDGVPAQRGALVLTADGTETTLAVLSDFAAGAEEGWALACADAGAVAAGEVAPPGDTRATSPFRASIRDLGHLVGRLHATLAETLGRHSAAPGTAAGWAEATRQQARQVLAVARAHPATWSVLDRAGDLDQRLARLSRLDDPGPLVRTHGDLHLGQVLRQGDRWLVLDFEGEPARPLQERRRPHSPLRDVAGMLRSFDYAAAQADLDVPPPLARWCDRLRGAFLDGYLTEGRPAGLLPDEEATRALLDAFELDKAVYELGYELANRPEWVAIPAGGILRVLDGR